MTIAPSGTSVGLPTTPGSCDTLPPPLVGGGQSPVQSPVQVGASSVPAPGTGGLGAPVPTTPAATATIGAATLGGAGPTAITTAAPVAVTGPLGATLPAAASVPITTAPATTAATAPAAATPQRLTTLAPGAAASDADLVESTLSVLRQSPAGAQVVDRLLAVGAKINVLSDAEIAAMGHGTAHAVYDPKVDTMFLRRSDLANTSNIGFAAVALAHEGTHLLDDVGKVDAPYVMQATQRVIAAGGPTTAAGIEAQEQATFELTMIKEARAFTFAGQVAKQLGVALPATDPTSVSVAGGNDQATYGKVFQSLLSSSYNPERRAAPIANF